jgi:hypothetical protein
LPELDFLEWPNPVLSASVWSAVRNAYANQNGGTHGSFGHNYTVTRGLRLFQNATELKPLVHHETNGLGALSVGVNGAGVAGDVVRIAYDGSDPGFVHAGDGSRVGWFNLTVIGS